MTTETKKEVVVEKPKSAKKEPISAVRALLLTVFVLLIGTPIAVFFLHFDRTVCSGAAYPLDGDLGNGNGRCERMEWYGSKALKFYVVGWYQAMSGDFKNGVLNGNGLYSHSTSWLEPPNPLQAAWNRVTIDTNWVDGKPNGYGSFTYSPFRGTEINYLGDIEDHTISCKSRVCRVSFSLSQQGTHPVTYVGNLVNNVLEGEGTLYAGSSSSPMVRIRGNFVNGVLKSSTEFYTHEFGNLENLGNTTSLSKFETKISDGSFSWDGTTLKQQPSGFFLDAENRQDFSQKKVPRGMMQLFECLTSLVSFEKNYQQYKDIVSTYTLHTVSDPRLLKRSEL